MRGRGLSQELDGDTFHFDAFFIGSRIQYRRSAGGRSLLRRFNLIGGHQIDCSYPLVADVLRLCFGLDKTPNDKSIEDLFAEAWTDAASVLEGDHLCSVSGGVKARDDTIYFRLRKSEVAVC